MRGQQKGVVGIEQGALYELAGGWVIFSIKMNEVLAT